MRLHGRNVENWWTHEKTEDQHRLSTRADELKEFTDTADAARRLVKKLYLYTNNHFSAKSVANAAMIKKQLGEPLGRRVSAGVRRALSGACRRREGRRPVRFSFTYVHSGITSPTCSRSNTSSPEMMWPNTVIARSSPDGRRASRRSGCRPAPEGRCARRRPRPSCAGASSSSPKSRSASAGLRRPPFPQSLCRLASRDWGSPHCTTNPGSAR